MFGTALSAFSEIGLPLLVLAKGPTATPPERHLAEYGAHVVYGLAVASVTQLLRRAL